MADWKQCISLVMFRSRSRVIPVVWPSRGPRQVKRRILNPDRYYQLYISKIWRLTYYCNVGCGLEKWLSLHELCNYTGFNITFVLETSSANMNVIRESINTCGESTYSVSCARVNSDKLKYCIVASFEGIPYINFTNNHISHIFAHV